jgi:hypothetical protein
MNCRGGCQLIARCRLLLRPISVHNSPFSGITLLKNLIQVKQLHQNLHTHTHLLYVNKGCSDKCRCPFISTNLDKTHTTNMNSTKITKWRQQGQYAAHTHTHTHTHASSNQVTDLHQVLSIALFSLEWLENKDKSEYTKPIRDTVREYGERKRRFFREIWSFHGK